MKTPDSRRGQLGLRPSQIIRGDVHKMQLDSSSRLESLMNKMVTSLLVLVALQTGIIIGLVGAPQIERRVRASTEPQNSPSSNSPTPSQSEQKLTPVQPSMTTGTVAIYLILSHHVQADQLVVNGYDILKLQNAELQLLSRFIPPRDIQTAVDGAKSTENFTVATPPQPQPFNTQPQK
jgi:hypothetical protein